MNALEKLLSELKEDCAGLEDKRQGLGYRYTMTDMAAFSVFFMQSPSFLGHQRVLAEGHGRSNCQTPCSAWRRSRATTTSARCLTAIRPASSTGCSSRRWRVWPRPTACRRSSAWEA